MRSKASGRFSRIAPRKARMIADLVRGRGAAEAIQLLTFTLKSGAPVSTKIIESAVANARQTGADVFVPFSSIHMNDYLSLEEGSEVEFDVKPGPTGMPAAHVLLT